jgi:hypothetical protein
MTCLPTSLDTLDTLMMTCLPTSLDTLDTFISLPEQLGPLTDIIKPY